MEDRIKQLETLAAELQDAIATGSAKQHFKTLFKDSTVALELLDDNAIAQRFSSSRSNASRWRRGIVVPPGAALILRLLLDDVEDKLKLLRRRAQSHILPVSRASKAPPQPLAAMKAG